MAGEITTEQLERVVAEAARVDAAWDRAVDAAKTRIEGEKET
jgi:hypothetical protein